MQGYRVNRGAELVLVLLLYGWVIAPRLVHGFKEAYLSLDHMHHL